NRCRVRGSYPAFQHFSEQVIVRSQRTKHRTDTDGRDVQHTVRSLASRQRTRLVSRHDRDFEPFRESNALLEHHDSVLHSTTSNHEKPPFTCELSMAFYLVDASRKSSDRTVCMITQERAYTSPLWYTPAK